MSLKGVSDRRVYHKDQVIFREGQEGHAAYLVTSGKIAITKGTAENTKVIATVGRNEIFGEMALVDGSLRMATAVTMEPSSCTIIDKEQFKKKLATLDQDTQTLFDFLMRYIRDTMPLEMRVAVGDTKETHYDIIARDMVESSDVTERLGKVDRFLKALYEILLSYASRRLPPKPAVGGNAVWEIE